MSSMAVTITCELDGQTKTFLLDTVNDTSIDASSTLTSHPIVSGDEVADHIYKNPITMTLTGTFSLNGSKGIVVDGDGSKLENFEKSFERIKNEAILCTIVKVTTAGSSSNVPKFSTRQNMCLTNINWIEKVNSVAFTLSFTQVLLATIQEYQVDTDDQFLPNVSEPATLNFTDTLLDFTKVDSIINSQLLQYDLMTDEFANYMKSMSASALAGLGVALAVALVVASIPGVGWVAVVTAAAIGFLAVIAVGIVNYFKGLEQRRKYKVEQFKYYKEDEKNKKEVQRYCNFIGQIHQQLSQLNDAIKVHAIASNEPQECMLNIDNNYYIFTFTKNNTTNRYSLVVTDINEKERATMNDITCALTDFSQCGDNNNLFRADEGGSYVYLIRVGEDATDLTSYNLLSSSIDLKKFNNVLYDIIKNSIVK